MSRHRMTAEEIDEKYQDIKEMLDELKAKRDKATSDEQRNEYTKKISKMRHNLNSFKERYINRISPVMIKEEKQQPTFIPKVTINDKLREIETRAKEMIENARTEEERKSIEERLEAVRLRAKYSYW